jgi:hypothetical protein
LVQVMLENDSEVCCCWKRFEKTPEDDTFASYSLDVSKVTSEEELLLIIEDLEISGAAYILYGVYMVVMLLIEIINVELFKKQTMLDEVFKTIYLVVFELKCSKKYQDLMVKNPKIRPEVISEWLKKMEHLMLQH